MFQREPGRDDFKYQLQHEFIFVMKQNTVILRKEIYDVASVEELERPHIAELVFKNRIYGEMPIQIGYCTETPQWF